MALVAIRLIEVIDQEVNEVEFVSYKALEDYAGSKKGRVRDKDDHSLIRNELRETVQENKKKK